MKVLFDDSNNFLKDLERLIAPLDRWDKPLVVIPTERDVTNAEKEFEETHVTFITYDYFLSKKWIADDDYDHIDFFRMDQFFMTRSYGVKVGVGTMKRIEKKKEEN